MKENHPLARALCAAPAIAGLACAAWWSVRLACADLASRANTVESLARAVALDPGNAAYRAWQAELEEHEGRDPTPALTAAAALNPRDSAVWIRLGLQAELQGDYPRAERHLLEAARVDRLSTPRATLLHYYFRRGDWERFWHWSRPAFEMSYGDRTPLFQLCWRATEDAALILGRAIPPQPEILAQYLRFLLDQGRLDAAAAVAQAVSSKAGPAETPLLLAYCDRLLEQGQAAPALEFWNTLCDRKLLPYPPLDPQNGPLPTNGDFSASPLRQGFDWRVAALPEVSIVRLDSPPALKFTLSGKQPERCDLLWQYIPLLPRRSYRLRFRYRTAGLAPDSGIRWRLIDAATPPLASEDWRDAELLFPSRDARLARLALSVEREPGSTRPEGSLWLAGVKIEFAP
ncbi:MAG: hypothetical protein HY822_07115 [Acidobacteria bacterium]|nr:hypothetical protein [Acidobacteriota bacterium]